MKGELKAQRGASMVEFAFVLPLLLLLVFGLIEFGLIFYDRAVVTNASREGARAGIVYDTTGTNPPLTAAEIGAVVSNYANLRLVTFASGITTTTTTATSCATVGRGNDITVTVSYPYTFLVFSNIAQLIGPSSLPGTITLSAQTVMKCE